MNRTKLVAAAAAVAIALGAGVGTAAPASAADNIKIFGEQERLNGPNGFPYIGYTVYKLAPSSDPVPHQGKLYAAKLAIDPFGGSAPPMIERFGARTEKGIFYPSIWGASNNGMLYFDVTGPEPNSVVWNDGVRDILAWVPGEIPLEGLWEAPPLPEPAPTPENSEVIASNDGSMPAASNDGSMPAESDPAIVATPNDLAQPPYQITESEVAQPGFNR